MSMSLELIEEKREELRQINLINAVKRLIRKYPVVTINFFGYMGTGKTNAAKYLAKNFEGKFKVYYAQAPEPKDAVEAINKVKGRRLLIILDDLSFKYHGKSKELREFENTITRIRHIMGSEKIILILIYHYLKAILPFMRIAQIHALFSVTQTELDMYSEIFWPRYLYYFYRLYDAIIWDNINVDYSKKRPVLVKAMTKHAISWIPLVDDYKFSNILSPNCKSEEEEEERLDWRRIAIALYLYLHKKYRVPKIVIEGILRRIMKERFDNSEFYDLMKWLDSHSENRVRGSELCLEKVLEKARELYMLYVKS